MSIIYIKLLKGLVLAAPTTSSGQKCVCTSGPLLTKGSNCAYQRFGVKPIHYSQQFLFTFVISLCISYFTYFNV